MCDRFSLEKKLILPIDDYNNYKNKTYSKVVRTLIIALKITFEHH